MKEVIGLEKKGFEFESRKRVVPKSDLQTAMDLYHNI